MIPAETLEKIFHHFIEAHRASTPELIDVLGLPKDEQFREEECSLPWIAKDCPINIFHLGHVCLYWRKVINSTSSLWCNIHVNSPKESHVEAVRVWLSRAGTRPLSLSIEEKPSPSTQNFPDPKTSKRSTNKQSAQRILKEQKAAVDVLQIFVSRRNLWKDIQFKIELMTYMALVTILSSTNTQLQGIDHGSLPFLESAAMLTSTEFIPPLMLFLTSAEQRLYIPGYMPKISLEDLWRGLHTLTPDSLRCVNWGTIYNISDLDYRPWSQLRHIELQFHNMTHFICLDIMARCAPYVEELRIGIINAAVAELTNPRHLDLTRPIQCNLNLEHRIVFHRLHTLGISSFLGTAPIFRNITVPALRNLAIAHFNMLEQFDRQQEELHTCLERSMTMLAHLRNGEGRGEIPEYVEIEPTLERFCIVDEFLGKEGLRRYYSSPTFANVRSITGYIS